jgi:hypothetical protein
MKLIAPLLAGILASPSFPIAVAASQTVAPCFAGGGLYAIDASRRVSKIDLGALPEAVDPAYRCASLRASGAFVSHGLSLKPNADGHQRLFVVRHGGREAIEVFRFERPDDVTSLEWIGCVPLPKDFSGNAVTGRYASASSCRATTARCTLRRGPVAPSGRST